MAAYGLPGNDNPVLFHSVLDTVEVLGSTDSSFWDMHLISWDASEEDGNHGLELEVCDENDAEPMPFFWTEEVFGGPATYGAVALNYRMYFRKPYGRQRRHWAAFRVPLRGPERWLSARTRCSAAIWSRS